MRPADVEVSMPSPEGADVDATLAGCVEGVDRVDKGAAQSIEGWHEEGVAFADVVESSSETGTIRVSGRT